MWSSASRPGLFPALRIEQKIFKTKQTDRIVQSHMQSRFLTLVYSCVIHAKFFVLMGVRKGFPAMMSAYILAAFGRGLLTGESARKVSALNEMLIISCSGDVGYVLSHVALCAQNVLQERLRE
jgi:hypothetical protein